MPLPATVELTNTLPAVVLAGNRIPLKFQASENYLENAGTKAKVILQWTADAVPNEYFDLLLFGETVRFTCKAAPDNSGVQFRDNSLAGTLNEWVALAAADLAANYLIARYYNLTVVDDTITIEAKEEGSDYSLEFTAGAGIDITATETDKTGVDRSIRKFYYVVVLLYVNDLFVKELLLNIDDDGVADVDISDFLKSYMSGEFEWPEDLMKFIYKRTGPVASWYFRYGEKWGSEDYRALTLSDTYLAIEGGYSWIENAKNNRDSYNFWEKLWRDHNFLTHAPIERKVTPLEPAKLYFMNWSGATEIILKAKLYYTGSTSTVIIDTLTGAIVKDIYELIISPSLMNLTGLDDETLLSFDLWIANENDVRISELRTLVIDYNHYENERYFLFKNSFGMYDVLRTSGKMNVTDEYTRETVSVESADEYTGKDRDEISITNLEQQIFSVSTGWLSKLGDADKYRNWLRDFCLSKQVFEISGDDIKPIRITSSSLENSRDGNNLKALTFEYRNAYRDEFYSNNDYDEQGALVRMDYTLVRNTELDNNEALT